MLELIGFDRAKTKKRPRNSIKMGIFRSNFDFSRRKIPSALKIMPKARYQSIGYFVYFHLIWKASLCEQHNIIKKPRNRHDIEERKKKKAIWAFLAPVFAWNSWCLAFLGHLKPYKTFMWYISLKPRFQPFQKYQNFTCEFNVVHTVWILLISKWQNGLRTMLIRILNNSCFDFK